MMEVAMVRLCSVEKDVVTLEVRVDISGAMLDAEERIGEALNEAGMVATQEALKRFDTDGTALLTGAIKWTSKGREEKIYQTPYGAVAVARHVYQTSAGGKTYCPLDRDARIVVSSTPRFAKMVSHKVAHNPITVVQQDLEQNHGRHLSRTFIHEISEAVGAIAQAKEEDWRYETPHMDCAIANVAIGMDGACMLLCEDGWREAMAGTIALYDKAGERRHTIYIGAAPEHGKAVFIERMEREIAHVKRLYPKAGYIGIADGAPCNWAFLERHTDIQVLDFWHAAQHLAEVAQAAFPRAAAERENWLDERCHDLKHYPGAVGRLLQELEEVLPQSCPKTAKKEPIQKAAAYFRHHQDRMDYADYRVDRLPIGSGVTEAACKTLVKHRLCASGMRWKERGASIILSLRALVLTDQRWEQFWHKISRYGLAWA
jgi:hypothetical protein